MTSELKNRLFILFTGHGAETLTPEEHTELQEHLRGDAEARRLWFVHQDVEAGVQIRRALPTVVQPVKAVKMMRWQSFRPLYAAAGLVVGLFCASPVFGFGSRLQVRIQTLLMESFEDAQMPLERGVPRRAEVWFGDLLAAESGEVKAAEGQRMVALLHVVKTVKTEPDAAGWATVRSLIDVPAGARVLLISLAAGLPGDPQFSTLAGGHFLDDVQVRLITQETLS